MADPPHQHDPDSAAAPNPRGPSAAPDAPTLPAPPDPRGRGDGAPRAASPAEARQAGRGRGHPAARGTPDRGDPPPARPPLGTIGIIGLGAFGRLLAAHIAPHAERVLLHDLEPIGADALAGLIAAATEAARAHAAVSGAAAEPTGRTEGPAAASSARSPTPSGANGPPAAGVPIDAAALAAMPRAGALASDPNAAEAAAIDPETPGAMPRPPRLEPADLATTAAAEVVVPAVTMEALGRVLDAIAPHVRPGSLVADVTSVKVRPIELMLERLPAHAEILGTHPLFGPQTVAERSAGGRGNPLAGLTVALCPVRLAAGRLDRIRGLLGGTLGLHAAEADPDEHDREMAYVQVITHLVGHACREMRLPELPLATVAYHRLLQLMHNTERDSAELFATIQHHNPHARGLRDEFARALEIVRRRCDALRLHAEPTEPG